METLNLEDVAFEIVWEFNPILISEHITFYHYTDEDSKLKIVNDEYYRFRFSKASKFADKNEGIHILEPYRHICGRLYNQNKIDKNFYNTIKNIDATKINPYINTPWILCATANGNSQYMKERYAPKDGFIIGFQALAFMDLHEAVNCDIYSYEVNYSSEDMKSRIEKYLLRLYEAYMIDKNSVKCKDKILKRVISNMLFKLSYCYKGEEYKEEEEIRLIVFLKDGFSGWSNDRQLSLYKYNEEIYLRMGKAYHYGVMTEPKWCNSKKFNKGHLTSDEIMLN